MSRAEETVYGAAPNVDTDAYDTIVKGPPADGMEPATDPFESDTDARRVIVCTCITCEATETIYAEPGRTRLWEQAREHPAHVIEYWREDSDTEDSE